MKECVAMILAVGCGERLGALTHHCSKPAIHFGGSHRIIDFALSSCKNSGIETVGILSQFFTSDLNEYIDSIHGGKAENRDIHLLPSKNRDDIYNGTADAVYKNLAFLERFAPEYVLVLASDHVYRMDYKKMVAFHKEKDADVTVASVSVPIGDASKFGILNADESGRVRNFEEKPRHPKSDLASMGVYVFKWGSLKKYLLKDSRRAQSQHDFGKDVLPDMLHTDKFYTYRFDGYWRDVGTVDKLWEANMEQLHDPSMLRLMDGERDTRTYPANGSPCFMSNKAVVGQSIVSGGCSIFGNIKHSVLGDLVTVGQGSEVVNSVVMPNVYIGNNVKIYNTIVGANAVIMDNTVIGSDHGSDFFVDYQVCSKGVSLVAPWLHIPEGMEIQKNSQIYKEILDYFSFSTMGKSEYSIAI